MKLKAIVIAGLLSSCAAAFAQGDAKPIDTVVLAGRQALQAAPTVGPDESGVYEIDVLILFTPRFAKLYGDEAGAKLQSQHLLDQANHYLEVTNLPIRYRLASAELYNGMSETVHYAPALTLLAADPAIRKWRDAVHADVVALLRANAFTHEVCGLSTPFNGQTQSSSADNVDPERDAFAIVGNGPSDSAVSSLSCPDWVLAHELGHLLAGGHEITTGSTYWRPYSHGYSCGISASGPFDDIMTTNPGLGPRGDFFSSPAVIRDGQPCGIDGHADNARAMLEAAPYVAAYR